MKIFDVMSKVFLSATLAIIVAMPISAKPIRVILKKPVNKPDNVVLLSEQKTTSDAGSQKILEEIQITASTKTQENIERGTEKSQEL